MVFVFYIITKNLRFCKGTSMTDLHSVVFRSGDAAVRLKVILR